MERSVNAKLEGDEMDINFNPRFFMDCLAQMEGEVEVRLKSDESPCLLTRKNDKDSRWIIMPMRF
ncbi:MAG: hypothetical protein U9P80_02620 [Thermodesulfobacteriota bacterium]|nr:hypothetical protein [Thermodesulfobacteriota bacterium]